MMKHSGIAVAVTSLMVVALMATGCGDSTGDFIKKNKPLVMKTLSLAGKIGANEGLKQWAKKDEAAAKEAAAALNRNLKEEVLPYFEGEGLKTSAEVNEFINSSLFKDVPDEVKLAIVTAAEVLDYYLPIPGSENLNEDHKDYLKSFLTGVQEGVDKFVGNGTVSSSNRSWLKG